MTVRLWLSIFATAIVVRLALALGLGMSGSKATAHHEHLTIARSLAEGRGFCFNFFGNDNTLLPTSQQAPFVPGMLAGFYLLLGVETTAAIAAALGLQILAGAATAAAVGSTAANISYTQRFGMIAGLAAACYPPMAVGSLHLQALPWDLFWLAHLLQAATLLLRQDDANRRGGWRAMGGFVAAAAGGILTDPILAAVVAVLWGQWLFIRLRKLGCRGLVGPAAAFACISLLLAPWLARNQIVHGRFVFIKDSFWYVFWQGNNLHSHGTDKLPLDQRKMDGILRTAGPVAALNRATAARDRSQSVDSFLWGDRLAVLAGLPTEIARMDQFRDWIVAELRAHPGRYATMCGKRLWKWIWFDDTNPRSYVWPYVASYLCLVLLALPSVPLAWKRRRHWQPIWLAGLALTAVHVGIITSARFRVPLEMLLLLPASATLSRLPIFPKKNSGPSTQAADGPAVSG